MKDGMPQTRRLIVVPPSSDSVLFLTSAATVLRGVGSRGSPVMAHFAKALSSHLGGPITGRVRLPSKKVVKAAARATVRQMARSLPKSVRVVDSSAPDGTVLIDPRGRSRTDVIKALPPGAELFEEQWYRLERSGAPWLLRTARARTEPPAGTGSQLLTVKVKIAGATAGLANVTVTVLLGRQLSMAKTSKAGIAKLRLPARAKNISRIYVDPLHSAWPIYRDFVPIANGKLEFSVPALDPQYQDTRNLVYGKAKARGVGVRVAVVDSGVGPHDALKVEGGRNTTDVEPNTKRTDWDGHGSHVAGVIASTAKGWRRGEASQVKLYAYRVFTEGAEFASNLAIRNAIVEAAQAGCCLINLSIGGGPWDRLIERAAETAWNLGAVCVAAAGNDGAAEVDVPARYPLTLGISAIGLEGSWPTDTTCELEVVDAPGTGKRIDGRRVFLTGFSNYGAEVDFASPGSAIVSTIFANRLGVMSGTSMATPVATGVLAARVASAGLHTMPATAERAAAIVKLAKGAAEKIGLPRDMQGIGLVR